MRTYLRRRVPGGLCFFTVNLAERQGNRLLVDHIDALEAAFRMTRTSLPFAMPGWVVLPDHLHCLWRLPPGDDDYPTRWRMIKSRFSRAFATTEPRNASRMAKGERGLWQRRYWEHVIRDDADLSSHLDCIHLNPVKHGHAARVADWQHSSFHRHVGRGTLSADWAGGVAHVE